MSGLFIIWLIFPFMLLSFFSVEPFLPSSNSGELFVRVFNKPTFCSLEEPRRTPSRMVSTGGPYQTGAGRG